MANALPYLRFNGVELNGAMPWTYLNKGNYVDARMSTAQPPASILFTDPTTGAVRTFTSPQADNAPWYDPAYPESADFLGLWIEVITGIDSTLGRTIDPRLAGVGGGVLGPLRARERSMSFKGMLFAGSQAALEYGERWLTDVLQGNQLTPCLPVTIDLRLAVPTGADTNTSRWSARNVGLIAGPKWGAAPVSGLACKMKSVQFTLASEYPYLFKPLVSLVASTVLYPAPPACTPICSWVSDYRSVTATLACNQRIGQNTAIIAVSAGSVTSSCRIVGRLGNALPAYTPIAGEISDPTNLFDIYVPQIPAGYTLQYDGSVHQINMIDAAGNSTEGTRYIALTPNRALDWPEVRNGSPVTLDVIVPMCSLNSTTSVKIDTVYRTI